MPRRKFLRLAVGGIVGIPLAGLGYSLFEAGWIRIDRQVVAVPRLPAPFAGKTVAFLTDLHHGPYTSLNYVRAVVELTNALAPDWVALGGDYTHRAARYIGPCLDVLAGLRATRGVFGVLGNHDHWHGAAATRRAMKSAGIVDLSNNGVWLSIEGTRLRLAGVDDLWEGEPDLDVALADATEADACLLLSHNPDYVETFTDRRVGLVLSGHTHGGQIVLPMAGAPIVPSRYGQKYLRGLIQTPYTQVLVSRGLGTVTPPLRFCCRPEINLITLAAARDGIRLPA